MSNIVRFGQTLLMTFLTVSSTLAAAGPGGTGGGDWFIKALPILKIQFPENSAYVEGVKYKKIMLPKCGHSKKTLKEYERIAYFPGRNFEAVKIQLFQGAAECSWGVVERNSEKALQILVNNDETNRDEVFNGTLIYSKTYGSVQIKGNFLVTPLGENKMARIGAGGVYYEDGFKALQGPFFVPGPFTEAIFVPESVEKSNRVYFGYSDWGQWRLLLPIAYTQGIIPLKELASDLAMAKSEKNDEVLDLINYVELPKEQSSNGWGPAWVSLAQIWHTLESSSSNVNLRDDFYKAYGINMRGSDQHLYQDIQKMTETAKNLDFQFTPTIGHDDIYRAGIRQGTSKVHITLPLLNPTWRVVADLIHEMTHALQAYDRVKSDDKTFQNEMEAHLNERAYLKELEQRYPQLKNYIETYGYITAVGVPKVRFVSTNVAEKAVPLCLAVIKAYKLDVGKISPSSLKRFDCEL